MSGLRVAEIHSDSGVRILLLESVQNDYGRIGGLCHVFGRIEPVAVVVCRPTGIHALDMDGEQILLEELERCVPELDGILRDISW